MYFVQGLFQHGSTTPTPRPFSASRQREKLRLSSFQMDPDRTTSQTPSSGISLLSQLDEDHSGYVSPESIIELWEKQGVPHGAQILQYLQFDIGNKINLDDLSYALNQELKATEEDNATYQAALVSYQCELNYLKTIADSVGEERDKLKTDLSEANARNALLLKEGEDSQKSLEKLRENEVRSMEKKHQEQLKQFSVDKEQERDILVHQSAREREQLEQEIIQLKDEENKLKQRLSLTQKDLERFEVDLSEMTEKCADLEKTVLKQQKDLDAASDLQRQLEEIEATRDDTINEHRKLTSQRIEHLEAENKELKDKNDEITMEVEEFKQQLEGKRPRRSRTVDARLPSRAGSAMSEKPVMTKSNSVSSGEFTPDEDEEVRRVMNGNKRQRSLPKRPKSVGGLQGVDAINNQDSATVFTESDVKRIEAEKEERIRKIENVFSIERKDMEDMFKMQITEIEEQHDKEKEELIKFFHKEKDSLRRELEKEYEVKQAKSQQTLTKDFAEEKQDIFLKFETEKNHLQQVFLEEKYALEDKIRNEMSEKLNKKLKEKQESFDKELDNSTSKSKEEIAAEQKQKVNLERQLNRLREEFEVEKVSMMNDFAREKADLERKHQQQVKDLEETLSKKGKEALRGRLQADFYALLEKEKEQITIEQVGNNKSLIEEETKRLNRQFDEEKQALTEKLKREKETLEKKYQEVVGEIKLEKAELSDRLNVEKVHLEKLCKQRNEELGKEYEMREQQLKKQKTELQEKVKELDKKVSDFMNEKMNNERRTIAKQEELAKDIQETFEEEFVEQIERIKCAFDEERSQMEANMKLLQQELDEANYNKKLSEVKIKQLEDELETVKASNNLLQARNQELETVLEKQRGAQNRIKELERELEDAKVAKKMQEKKEMEAILSEKLKIMNSKIQQEEEKTANANVALRLAQAAHQREQLELKDKMNKMIEKDQYDLIHEQFISVQTKVAELEQIVAQRGKDASKMVANTHTEYKDKLKVLTEQKEEVDKKLSNAQDLLKDQTAKLLEELAKNSETDILIKDLYVENSQLMKVLHETERREKEVSSKMSHLEEKYKTLQNVVTKISMAALS